MTDPETAYLTNQQTAAIKEEAQRAGLPIGRVFDAIIMHGLSVWIELRERMYTIRMMSEARDGSVASTALDSAVNAVAESAAVTKPKKRGGR